jgi:tRNA-2-methylthio-N6-dimethylallyladenosine synthase
VPALTLSTDVIVGFPGETAADFEQTLGLVRELGFIGVFGFKYSPRPFTPALKLDDDVSEEEKSERLTRLFELSEALRAAHLDALVGTAQRVLVEGKGERGGYTGRTERIQALARGHSARSALAPNPRQPSARAAPPARRAPGAVNARKRK